MSIINCIVLVAGVVALAISSFMGFQTYSWLSKAKLTPSKVVRLDEHKGKKNKTMYTPVFEYNVDGSSRTYKPSSSISSPSYEVGEEVNLAYDASSGEASVATMLEAYGFTIITFFVGLITIVISVLYGYGDVILKFLHPNLVQ